MAVSKRLEWRPVPGYEGLYEVSSFGDIKSKPRPRTKGGLLKPSSRDGNYLNIELSKDGEQKTFRIHVLVLLAFKGPRPDGYVGRHLNGDNKDNWVGNLEWGTKSDNAKDMVKHGRCPLSRETRNW